MERMWRSEAPSLTMWWKRAVRSHSPVPQPAPSTNWTSTGTEMATPYQRQAPPSTSAVWPMRTQGITPALLTPVGRKPLRLGVYWWWMMKVSPSVFNNAHDGGLSLVWMLCQHPNSRYWNLYYCYSSAPFLVFNSFCILSATETIQLSTCSSL